MWLIGEGTSSISWKPKFHPHASWWSWLLCDQWYEHCWDRLPPIVISPHPSPHHVTNSSTIVLITIPLCRVHSVFQFVLLIYRICMQSANPKISHKACGPSPSLESTSVSLEPVWKPFLYKCCPPWRTLLWWCLDMIKKALLIRKELILEVTHANFQFGSDLNAYQTLLKLWLRGHFF